MRPGARLAAVIDILSRLEEGASLRSILSGWGRANRYAGSRDRAAINALIHDVLRQRASLALLMNSSSPRSLALGAMGKSWAYSLEEISALCDGQAYSPAPLSKAERLGLERIAHGQPPAKASLLALADLPQWLDGEFREAFGSQQNIMREGQAMARRAPVDLRVNLLRASRSRVKKALAGYEPEEISATPWGLRIMPPQGGEKGPALEHGEAFAKGWFELQDKGSQLAALYCGAQPGMQVLDLCAGGGGKTLALAAMMENRGQIHAYDISPRRLAGLRQRMKRAGAHNISVLPGGDEKRLAELGGSMDLVVVDAPCSGSGIWRRKPESKWRLTPEQLARRISEQRQLLQKAAHFVRPGGRLAYITCSILPSENTHQIKWLLEKEPHLKMASQQEEGMDDHSPLPPTAPPLARGMIQLTPARHDCDGFFIAIMEKEKQA